MRGRRRWKSSPTLPMALAWAVIVGIRFRRAMMPSSHSVVNPETTWRSGTVAPATGLQTWTSRIASTSSRSAAGARATMGRSSSPSRKTPTGRPLKLRWSVRLISRRLIPALDAASSVSRGRTTMTGSRQSSRTSRAADSSRMMAFTFSESCRSTRWSGPRSRASMSEPPPGPRT